MRFLDKDPNIMILADGVMGIKIFNFSNPSVIPVEISSIQLTGVTINIEASLDENYIFVSATDSTLLTCLKISDLTSIKVFQTLDTGESGLGTAVTSNLDYLAVSTYNGIKIIPLNPSIDVNTETFVQNKNTGLLERRNVREAGFYVGE
jgi:hypothetical protein